MNSAGLMLGWLTAPFFAFVSFVRKARTFHPRGPVLHALVEMHPRAAQEVGPLARRLEGFALVRFSGALWKRAEGVPDVLGCALRLRRAASNSSQPDADDQDLLFATIRRPWTMPLAPLSTNVRDYFANDYFAVSPFEVGLEQRVYLKLHPEEYVRSGTGTRRERLQSLLESGSARLRLDYSTRPFGPWRPLLEVSLQRFADVDGEALRFSPFHAGRGVQPSGFIHALRVGAYSASQWARPARRRSARAEPQPEVSTRRHHAGSRVSGLQFTLRHSQSSPPDRARE